MEGVREDTNSNTNNNSGPTLQVRIGAVAGWKDVRVGRVVGLDRVLFMAH